MRISASSGLNSVRPGADVQIPVRLRKFQVAKNVVIHLGQVMLAGVNQNVLNSAPLHLANQRSHLDEVRPRPDNRRNFQIRITPSPKFTVRAGSFRVNRPHPFNRFRKPGRQRRARIVIQESFRQSYVRPLRGDVGFLRIEVSNLGFCPAEQGNDPVFQLFTDRYSVPPMLNTGTFASREPGQ